MSNTRFWTAQEIQFLRQHYPSASQEFLTSGLPNRSIYSIRRKANDLGITRSPNIRPTTGSTWSQSELNVIRNHYRHKSKEFMVNSLPGRSWESICNTASRLGVSRAESEQWTVSETNLLKKSFATSTWDELFRLLPNRSRSSILRKAEKLGLTRSRSDMWTGEENTLLREHYPSSSWETLYFLLPSRTKASISHQARKLGLSRKVGS